VRILLIEDDLAEARLLQEIFKSFDLKLFNLVHVKRLREALDLIQTEKFDAILLDLTLPDSQGLEAIELLMEISSNLPIVILTNTNDERLAIDAVRRGAQDYLVKRQVNIEVLIRSIQYAIERQRTSELLRAANENLIDQVKTRTAELIKAKEIDRQKSELVSMFSHDFRNPLTTVLSCAELLQNRSDLLTEEKKVALFQMIRTASKNMAQLLDEVLLVGKADAGTLECNLASLDLIAFCSSLIEELQITADRRQIDLVFVCQLKIPQSLWDKSLLRHILGNLLVNALKYSPEGSQVNLELIAQEERVIFKIQDWGIGIPPEDEKHLFEPFHRASNVGKIPGTGLGLAIVKSCVDTCNGTIDIESKVGFGTIVTVVLPLSYLQ
jgi:signal transduction histidine kinase